jgi:hypothetical protein
MTKLASMLRWTEYVDNVPQDALKNNYYSIIDSDNKE